MSILDFSDIRSWLTQGMISTGADGKPGKPRRGKTWMATVLIGGAAMLATQVATATTEAIASSAPVQLSLSWPGAPSAYVTRESLSHAVRAIRDSQNRAAQATVGAADLKSLALAENMVSEIPDFIANATAGVNADGNVYFRFQQGKKVAVVTVEATTMQALYMAPGYPSVYIEDEPFRGKKLPSPIKKLLQNNLGSA